jgi:hypothetical protein
MRFFGFDQHGKVTASYGIFLDAPFPLTNLFRAAHLIPWTTLAVGVYLVNFFPCFLLVSRVS